MDKQPQVANFTNSCKIIQRNIPNGQIEIKIFIEDLDEYGYYIDAINTIMDAEENTNILLIINSAGGYVTIMDAFLSAIDISRANSIIAVIVGEACSAAAIIALACDDIVTTYHSKMLIHSSSRGLYGKLNDLHSHLEISKVTQNRIAKRYYKTFLTEDEIEEVLLGKELWLTADEITERWKLVLEEREKEIQKQEEDHQKEAEQVLIKAVEDLGYEVSKRKGMNEAQSLD